MNAAQDLELHDDAPFSARALFRLLTRIRHGRLTLVTPDGVRRQFNGPEDGPHAQLVLADWDTIPDITRGAEIALFECWRDRRLSTPDMTALLRFATRNQKALEEVFYGHPVVAFLWRVAHALRPNTKAGARRNIHKHYDLGNDFYRLWLDPTMTYSSAIFAGDLKGDLVGAQHAKYDRLLDVLGVESHHRVLEVGCGWGGFAERAAATRGCHVTGLTISRAQLEYAQARIKAAGLDDRVDLRFCDYRDSDGQFDRIVSIEMVEAVGERYWPTYFRTIRERLKPGGRAAIQSITIDESAFERYRRSSDFIREHVFPGGMLPSVERFAAEARAQGLEVVGEPYRFGRDYAETLRRWRRDFDAREAAIRAQGFDDAFFAMWRFYLHYCEAGFDEGRVDVVQVELRRPE